MELVSPLNAKESRMALLRVVVCISLFEVCQKMRSLSLNKIENVIDRIERSIVQYRYGELNISLCFPKRNSEIQEAIY
jgi:hypothetical protein